MAEEAIWHRLTLEVPRATEEAISGLLIGLGANGVEIEDSADYLTHEAALGEVMPEVTQQEQIHISAYFPATQQLSELKNTLHARLSNLTEIYEGLEVKISDETLAEEDWANGWKQYFKPVRISSILTIVPTWTDYIPKNADEKCIVMDPGMAFGTGTHPTTRLSLYALEACLRGGETVIDVGTGSGVLSIASVLLGAKHVYAYDLDEVAVRVAQENIVLNPGHERISVAANDLLTGLTQKVDVIVANILADILLRLLDDAYALLNDEGTLILSGIIDKKAEEVLGAARDAGFQLETQMQQGEWHCLVLKKTSEELIFG
jgi:ribosomal protein L11 methyltransferase